MKLLKVVMAAVLLAAMVAPAIAEDRLSLSGEMRVRAFTYDSDYKDYTDYGECGTVECDSNGDDSGAWNDQRLRINGSIAVAEGVSVNFRLDATESDENNSNAVAWGGSNSSAYQYSQRRADIQFDKAYLQLKKGDWTFQAGQLYFGSVGYTKSMIDVVGAGFTNSYKGFKLQHVKRMDENNGNNSFGHRSSTSGDMSLSNLSYTYKGDGFSVQPTVSYNKDSGDTNYDLLGFGLSGSTTLGPVALKGEFNYFDGETDTYRLYPHALSTIQISDPNGIDIKGMQFFLDGSMAATDTVRIGLSGWYAQGQDDDIQGTGMSRDANVIWDFADYHPENYGYQSVDFIDQFYNIYDPAGTNGGVIAGQLYSDIQANEKTKIQLAAMYFSNEDDEFAEYDGYSLNAGITYQLFENTTINAHANYINWSFDEVVGTSMIDPEVNTFQTVSGINVKF